MESEDRREKTCLGGVKLAGCQRRWEVELVGAWGVCGVCRPRRENQAKWGPILVHFRDHLLNSDLRGVSFRRLFW